MAYIQIKTLYNGFQQQVAQELKSLMFIIWLLPYYS